MGVALAAVGSISSSRQWWPQGSLGITVSIATVSADAIMVVVRSKETVEVDAGDGGNGYWLGGQDSGQT